MSFRLFLVVGFRQYLHNEYLYNESPCDGIMLCIVHGSEHEKIGVTAIFDKIVKSHKIVTDPLFYVPIPFLKAGFPFGVLVPIV